LTQILDVANTVITTDSAAAAAVMFWWSDERQERHQCNTGFIALTDQYTFSH